MTVCVDSASNMAVERPAGSHSLAAAAHCQRSAACDGFTVRYQDHATGPRRERVLGLEGGIK